MIEHPFLRTNTCYAMGSQPKNESFQQYLNVHPLEVVSRYRDPQLQMDENKASCQDDLLHYSQGLLSS